MGILDDAIREHLELKRRRGADPSDIQRAEREALGPVRRRVEEPADLDEPGAADHEDLIDEGLQEDWDEPMPEAPGVAAGEDQGYHEPEAPRRPADIEDEDPFPAAEAPSPQRASQRPVHGLEKETSEYDVPLEHDPEGEDVLEETPDFLQDTPDHDRLWFEQRPPRDFDFDG